jgi:hypothetical protein
MLIAVSEETEMRESASSPVWDLEVSVQGCGYKRGGAVSLVGDVAALAIGQSDLPILI